MNSIGRQLQLLLMKFPLSRQRRALRFSNLLYLHVEIYGLIDHIAVYLIDVAGAAIYCA